MSYIDREALERKIHTGMTIIQAMQVIIDEPAADVVEVVRCHECTLHDSCYTEDVFKFARLNDDRRFCSFGESHRRGE